MNRVSNFGVQALRVAFRLHDRIEGYSMNLAGWATDDPKAIADEPEAIADEREAPTRPIALSRPVSHSSDKSMVRRAVSPLDSDA